MHAWMQNSCVPCAHVKTPRRPRKTPTAVMLPAPLPSQRRAGRAEATQTHRCVRSCNALRVQQKIYRLTSTPPGQKALTAYLRSASTEQLPAQCVASKWLRVRTTTDQHRQKSAFIFRRADVLPRRSPCTGLLTDTDTCMVTASSQAAAITTISTARQLRRAMIKQQLPRGSNTR